MPRDHHWLAIRRRRESQRDLSARAPAELRNIVSLSHVGRRFPARQDVTARADGAFARDAVGNTTQDGRRASH